LLHDQGICPEVFMHPLSIHPNRRLIQRSDGKPFFWLGDTAWELFHRLTREQIDAYLNKRAGQKFTLIQAVVLAECDGLREPNREGELPLVELDPTRPNEKYFGLVDHAVDRSRQLGLTMGLLPTWGDKVTPMWGAGPSIFTQANAHVFGTFLARRYRDEPIVWILGGDRPVQDDGQLAIWRAMARGIREVVGQKQLITFHPMGGNSSSRFVHAEAWLDLNMLQSGHTGFDVANWSMIRADRALEPVKPTLDGEPNYEDHPVMSSAPGGDWHPIPGQIFDDYDARKALWRGLLSGACGHTYGCHPVWQMFDPTLHKPINFPPRAWHEAIDLPGANQVRHARSLFESIAWEKLIPDDTIIQQNGQQNASVAIAARADDFSYALIYVPLGYKVKLNLGLFMPMNASLYDPRTGERKSVGPVAGRCEVGLPDRSDWVVVVG
jgi:hypothetical protein